MDRNDQQAIEQLFGKLSQVENQAAPRDAEADAFIQQQLARQPGAAYYMAQTIVVQEQALEQAQARIEELQSQGQRSSGGLFGGLFGGGGQAESPSRRGSVPMAGSRSGMGGGMGAMGGGRGGGGFLAGAASTAMGVAGGVLLANAIGGMFGADEAQAAEAEQPVEDAGMDEAGMDDGGFDAGGDFGGDF